MALLQKLNKLNPDPNTEMGFIDHLEALRWHIFRMLLALLISSVVCYYFIDYIFDRIILGPTHKDFASYRFLCWLGGKTHISDLCLKDIHISFQNTELSGQFMMGLTSAFVFGFIIAIPYIFWELWRFLKPALSPHEIKNTRGLIFWMSLLFFCGVAFGYYVIAPYTINFFANYTLSTQFQNIIKIDDYLSNLISFVIGAGFVFQLPIVVFFLSKIGLLTPTFMRNTRRYSILIIVILAAIIAPPDMFSMILITIPLIILFELSILISQRVEKQRKIKEKEFYNS